MTEGAAGGTANFIGELRNELKKNDFEELPLDPAVAAKSTGMFIPFASALMLDGVGPADDLTPESIRAASAFDEVYFETTENLDHLCSSGGWFRKEVLALFDTTVGHYPDGC